MFCNKVDISQPQHLQILLLREFHGKRVKWTWALVGHLQIEKKTLKTKELSLGSVSKL